MRKQLNDPTQAVISSRAGAGGHGRGLEVMKARNAGEARWAKNMAKQNREWRAREAHKTRVGFTHNSQKRGWPWGGEAGRWADGAGNVVAQISAIRCCSRQGEEEGSSGAVRVWRAMFATCADVRVLSIMASCML